MRSDPRRHARPACSSRRRTAAAQDPASRPARRAVGTTTRDADRDRRPERRRDATYHFEYGTTTAYGLADAGAVGRRRRRATCRSGDAHRALTAVDDLPLPARRGRRRRARTATFTTARAAEPRRAGDLAPARVRARRATSARLTARIDPNRAATTWHVEWGTATASATARRTRRCPPGDGGVAVSLVARRAAVVPRGSTGASSRRTPPASRRSGTPSFTTLRAPTGVTLSVFPPRDRGAGPSRSAAACRGAGVNGLTVALEQSSFPFAAGFHAGRDARASNRTRRLPLRRRARSSIATRFRAVTPHDRVGDQRRTIARACARASGSGATRKTRRALRLAGGVNPGLPTGRATLQRRTRSAAGRS